MVVPISLFFFFFFCIHIFSLDFIHVNVSDGISFFTCNIKYVFFFLHMYNIDLSVIFAMYKTVWHLIWCFCSGIICWSIKTIKEHVDLLPSTTLGIFIILLSWRQCTSGRGYTSGSRNQTSSTNDNMVLQSTTKANTCIIFMKKYYLEEWYRCEHKASLKSLDMYLY